MLTKTPEAAKPETPTVSLSDGVVDGRLGRYKETVEKSGAALSSPASAPPAKDVKPPVTPSATSSDTKAVTGEAAQPIVYAGVKHEKTRERLHRASNMARGVIEDEVKRVERIRHVSSAMIEGATYDPSLRFVLVALGIFIVFVILLVLSKVMG